MDILSILSIIIGLFGLFVTIMGFLFRDFLLEKYWYKSIVSPLEIHSRTVEGSGDYFGRGMKFSVDLSLGFQDEIRIVNNSNFVVQIENIDFYASPQYPQNSEEFKSLLLIDVSLSKWIGVITKEKVSKDTDLAIGLENAPRAPFIFGKEGIKILFSHGDLFPISLNPKSQCTLTFCVIVKDSLLYKKRVMENTEIRIEVESNFKSKKFVYRIENPII